MMKCDACGAPVENGKCTYCGKVFAEAQPKEIRIEATSSASVAPTNKKGNPKKLTVCKACGHEIAKGAKVCPSCGAKVKKPIFKKWWFWLIIICLIGGIGGGTSSNTSSNNTNVEQQQVVEQKQEQAVEQKQEDNVPTEYKSALKKAKSYSDMMHMSKKAIYDQLVSEYGEKFPADAAQYAIDNLDADYKANALEKAK